jgi:hypothetical protein
MRNVWVCLPLLLTLGGCNWFNNVTGLTREANKAVGAACRQTGRSLEECYLRNPDADKAALYSGWREMHEYMEKHNLQTMAPPPEASVPAAATAVGKSEKAGEGGTKPTSSKAEIIQPPLTDEAADKAEQNDPQVQAVLAAVKSGDKKKASTSPGALPEEADQKKLLDLINQLNQQQPSAAPAAAPTPLPASKG